MTRGRAGFCDIPLSAVDDLEAGDDSPISRHILSGTEGLHQFVDCGVAVEVKFGSFCVRSLTEALGII